MNKITKLKQEFSLKYNIPADSKEIRIFAAPGRVNLIGEHIDYNGGHVFPICIDKQIIACAKTRNDTKISFSSLNFPDISYSDDLSNIVYNKEDGWTNYPKGVIKTLLNRGYKLNGIDLMYDSNIPVASGLSSSAAIEVVTGFAACTLSGINIDKKELALICQEAENRFVGMNCGIMDQFIISSGKENNAMLLNCNSLDYEHVPFNTKDLNIIICNTRVPRKLVDSEYNKRREECCEGLKLLNSYTNKNMKFLCDMEISEFEKCKNKLPEILMNRCQHVIYENGRVLKSKDALNKKNLAEFGKLLVQSHNSLRDLYEVSCRELDIMVELALSKYDIYGARMTGAGFGGCTVNLVKKHTTKKFVETIYDEYKTKTGIEPEIYVCAISGGVKEIQEKEKK